MEEKKIWSKVLRNHMLDYNIVSKYGHVHVEGKDEIKFKQTYNFVWKFSSKYHFSLISLCQTAFGIS